MSSFVALIVTKTPNHQPSLLIHPWISIAILPYWEGNPLNTYLMPREIKSSDSHALEQITPEQGPVEELALEAKILDFLQSEDVELLPEQLIKYSNLLIKHLNGELVSKREKMIAANQYKHLSTWFTTEYEGQVNSADTEEEEEESPKEEAGQMSQETFNHIRYGGGWKDDLKIKEKGEMASPALDTLRVPLDTLVELLNDTTGISLMSCMGIEITGDATAIRYLLQRAKELSEE